MDNEPTYKVPFNPKRDGEYYPGTGRKVWFGLLCLIGTGTGLFIITFIFISFYSYANGSFDDLIHNLETSPKMRWATINTLLSILIFIQIYLERQYFQNPNKSTHRHSLIGYCVIAVWLVYLSCSWLSMMFVA